MSKQFAIPERKKRKWISYCYYGCLYNEVVKVVMRCPVVNGVALIHLAWQHKIVAT